MQRLPQTNSKIQLFWWMDGPREKHRRHERRWPLASAGQLDRRVIARVVTTSPFSERDARTGSHALLHVHVRPVQSETLPSPVPWTILPEGFRRLRKAMMAAQEYIDQHPEIDWLGKKQDG